MTPLERSIRARIERSGPIPVAEFMSAASADPRHGYYRGRDPLGRAGDFITAPEISQVFGELIGAWCAVAWRGLGAPSEVVLVELGPGRGTLLADALRAVAAESAFTAALRIHLVEQSPVLRARQRRTLSGLEVHWHDRFESVPEGPLLLIANEFFDALAVEQLVWRGDGWRWRCVGIDPATARLAFVDGGPAELGEAGTEGAIRESSPAGLALAGEIGARIARHRGAALIVDYGHARTAPGETLQAVARHRHVGVLSRPGEADLSAHVDFAALARAARAAGARAYGPIGQGAFLERLGIGLRMARLLAGASPRQADEIRSGCRRLVAPDGMGTLFKALALSDPASPVPAGFEEG